MRTTTLARAMRLLLPALLLAACGGGGGGGGGGGTVLPGDSGGATHSSVTLAWAPAEGAVAGYSVFVQRGRGDFLLEAQVEEPQVTLTGEVGSTARVIVVGFNPKRLNGPASRPSTRFAFPDPGVAAASAASAASAPEAIQRASDPSASEAAPPDAGGAASGDAPPEGETPDASHLAGALVWQSGDALRVTDAELVTTQLFSRPAPDLQLATAGDLDGDGLGDLLWVDPAGGLSFTPAAALAGDPVATPAVDFGLLEAGERVAGAGDFDGDGVGDLLVMRAGDTVDVWFTMPDGSAEIAEIGRSDGARLVGTGDFDGVGGDDVAWDAGGGLLVVWLVDASGARESVEIAFGADLEIVGSGDFDGDGTADVALRDGRGGVYVVDPLAAPEALAATDLADAGAWTPAGTVDLDRDGTDDLVLVADGAIRTAYLPGGEVRALDPGSPWALVALLP